jgi:Zn-dependent protease with chaperone function
MALIIATGLSLLLAGNITLGQADEKGSPLEPSAGPVDVPEPSAKALEYYNSGIALRWISLLWQLAILSLFLFTGLSAWIRRQAERIGRNWFFTFVIYFLIFSILNYLLYFPLGYFQGFIRPHSYDLSDQAFSKWLGDSLKGLLVSLVLSVMFLWIPYLLMKKSPKRWWVYSGILAAPIIFFMVLIEPIWIEPLFNDFGEMKNKQLEAEILALADRAGIEGARVFEVNKSTDTKTVNAYVTGLGNTKRIVLWDTLLNKLDEKEILFVMGHEMGHYVLNHVLQGVLFAVAVVFVGLYLVHRISRTIILRWQSRLGFNQLDDVASWPLILLVGNLLYLLVAPGVMAFRRHLEHEADRFGLEITQDNHPAAMSFVRLLDANLSNPRPGWLYNVWHSSHPTPAERIEFCNEYRPWENGERLRYGDRFRGVKEAGP